MKRIALLLSTLLFLVCLTGCAGQGTPPVLNFDGIDITIGESSPGDLTDFDFYFTGNQPAIGSLERNSWLQNFMVAKHDDETFAYLYVYNPTRETVPYLSAKIFKINFHFHSEEYSYYTETPILINGIDFSGMDADGVRAAMEDYKLGNVADSGNLRYDDGDYSYYFRFADSGILDEIQVEMDIPKSYS